MKPIPQPVTGALKQIESLWAVIGLARDGRETGMIATATGPIILADTGEVPRALTFEKIRRMLGEQGFGPERYRVVEFVRGRVIE